MTIGVKQSYPALTPVNPVPTDGCCIPLTQPNLFFATFDGSAPVTNQIVTLPFPCTDFIFQWPTYALSAAWIHWQPLTLDGDENDLVSLNANGIYVGIPGMSLVMSEAVGTPVGPLSVQNQAIKESNQSSPYLRFKQPITQFFISGWGRDILSGAPFDLEGTIVCSDMIESINSYPIGSNR